jgi:hypothetical protein
LLHGVATLKDDGGSGSDDGNSASDGESEDAESKAAKAAAAAYTAKAKAKAKANAAAAAAAKTAALVKAKAKAKARSAAKATSKKKSYAYPRQLLEVIASAAQEQGGDRNGVTLGVAAAEAAVPMVASFLHRTTSGNHYGASSRRVQFAVTAEFCNVIVQAPLGTVNWDGTTLASAVGGQIAALNAVLELYGDPGR